MRRWLPRLLVALAALLGAAGFGAWRYARGGFETPRSPAELDAELRPHDRSFAPAGSGPFPAVVQLHGCGGDSAQQRDWAELFAAHGLFALAVDSYRGRGISADRVCAGRALLPVVRAADALVSLAAARRDPRVDASRIALAGWSHGASSLIELLGADPPREPLPALLPQQPSLGLDGLAGVLLVYPYCGFGVRALTWRSPVPVLMLLAEQDSLADPAPCLDLAARLREAGRPVEVKVYPGVDHGFDFRRPPADWTLRRPDAEMASRAERDALEFLRRVLGADRAELRAPRSP